MTFDNDNPSLRTPWERLLHGNLVLQTEFHRDYVCHICGKVSANRQCHRVHVRDHFPAHCDACDLRLVLWHFQGRRVRHVTCVILSSFVGFWRLKVHRIREHRSPLNCEECGMLFKVIFTSSQLV